ncbi:MAG: AI-2E family transporter [Ligilactobacillus acidipiscis]|jgi:predicted PurR-regulated permease PerM|nr:AI-2E family transporter [Ligilactobacillus acidipiscis]
MKLTRTQVIQTALVVAVFLICLVYPSELFTGFTVLYKALLPLIIGAVFAYCINLLCVRLERYFWPKSTAKFAVNLRRPVVIFTSLVLILLVITGVLWMIIPQLVAAINNFFTSLPKTLEELNQWLKNSDQATDLTQQITNAEVDWASIKDKVMNYASSGVSGLLSRSISLFGSFTSGIFDFILAFIFAIYLVNGKEYIGSRLDRVGSAFLPAKVMQKIHYVLHETNIVFSSFIVGQILEAFILGTLCTLGMLLFRFPSAVSIGALIGMTALVPMIGAFIGGAVGFVLIAGSNPLQAVLFIVFLICLQQIEGDVIYPRVVGDSVGLPGIVILAAVTVGSALGGIIGMLLGVPIAATAYRLIHNATLRREEHKASR